MAKKPTNTPATEAELQAPPIGPNEPAAVAAEAATENTDTATATEDGGEAPPADPDLSGNAVADPTAEFSAPDVPLTDEEKEAFRLEQEAVNPAGTGYVVHEKVIYVNEPCPACGGKGTVKCSNAACGADHKCPKCQGTGKRRLNATEALLIHHAREQRNEGLDVVKTGECANVIGGAVSTVQITLGRLAGWGLFERLTQGKAPDSSKTEWRLAI